MAANFSYLSYLNVSLRSNSESGMIYANTRNQVEIVVNFIALNNMGEQVFLTKEQMQSSISLCDFYTGEALGNDGWNVTSNAGEFVSDGILLDHASSFTSLTRLQNKLSTGALKSGIAGYLLPQSFSLWVTVENSILSAKSIAVKIFDGDKTTYDSTFKSDFESRVVLEPVPEKSYTMRDMLLSPDSYLENGSPTTDKHSTFFSFINNSLVVKKVDGVPYNSDIIMCTNLALWEQTARFVYIDGLYSGIQGRYTAPNGTEHNFSKNERQDQLCFTLISFVGQGDVANFYEPVVINVYDQYGNKGRFTAGINSPSAEDIKIVITDA